MGFLQAIAVQAGLAALLALGMTLVVKSGVYSVASSGFYLLGAYTTAIGTTRIDLPPILLVLIGALLSAVLGLVCIAPASRVRSDQLLLLTLAFAEGLRQLALGFRGFTGGALGIPGVPPLIILGVRLPSSSIGFLVLVWLAVIFILYLSRRLFASPWGLRLDVAREDETAAASLGIAASHYRFACHSTGAAIASVAGSLYAHYLGYVSPSTFTIPFAVFVLGALVLGGIGSPAGAILGATLVSALQPLFQLVGASTFHAAAMRQIAFGALLVILISFRPSGLSLRSRPLT